MNGRLNWWESHEWAHWYMWGTVRKTYGKREK